jgi:ferredoxin
VILIDYDVCDYCGACVGTCPVNVIDLLDAKLIIDQLNCIDCGICVKACPVGALELKKGKPEEMAESQMYISNRQGFILSVAKV